MRRAGRGAARVWVGVARRIIHGGVVRVTGSHTCLGDLGTKIHAEDLTRNPRAGVIRYVQRRSCPQTRCRERGESDEGDQTHNQESGKCLSAMQLHELRLPFFVRSNGI